jgi:putative nucleotidyltransferase with HDIG domain
MQAQSTDLPADLAKKLSVIEKLPTLPVVIENLGRALEDPDVDASRVAGIIADDPAIMARIMKVVGSVYYSGAQEPPSLQAAIVRLGFRTVSNIAMSAAVFSTFPPSAGTVFDRDGFWRHSIAAGVAAESLQPWFPGFASLPYAPDVLQLCGLLHDIGKIIFEQFFHDRFVEALELSKSRGMSLSAAEDRVLGADHSRVGAWLGRRWSLSEPVLSVVRWHHSPGSAPEAHRELTLLCYLANNAVNAAGLGNSGNSYPRYARKIEHEFDLDHEHLVQITELIREKVAQAPLLETLAEH